MMTDKEIIALYFKRSENAIEQTDEKYGRLCHSISINILNDTRDSEECVNDTYLTLWNKIPPKEPNPFKAYICRIIKNLSLKNTNLIMPKSGTVRMKRLSMSWQNV